MESGWNIFGNFGSLKSFSIEKCTCSPSNFCLHRAAATPLPISKEVHDKISSPFPKMNYVLNILCHLQKNLPHMCFQWIEFGDILRSCKTFIQFKSLPKATAVKKTVESLQHK